MRNKGSHNKCPRNYGELHSISTIKEVYDKSKSGDSIVISKIFSYFILSHNISKILDLNLRKDLSQFTKRCNWLNSFTQYHRYLNSQIKPLNLLSSAWTKELFDAQNAFLKIFGRFDDYLSGILSDDKINIKDLLKEEELHSFKLFITSIPHIIIQINDNCLKRKNMPNDSLSISSIMNDSSINHIGYVAEFRLLHQIQEFYFNDINNVLSKSIEYLQEENYIAVIQSLVKVNTLFELTHKANYILLQNLSVDDYHYFREYLGQSSGIQSEAICSINFRKLYPNFAKKVAGIIKNNDVMKSKSPEFNLLLSEAFKLSSNIHNWKEIHLLFPINYLGGKNKSYGTSSMIGVKDGLNTVINLLERGYKNDPLLNYYNPEKLTTKKHFPSNLYSYLIESTGKDTQKKFPNVQKRAHNQ